MRQRNRPIRRLSVCSIYEATGRMLADPQVDLAGAMITADPLHNKHDTVQVITCKGGDYLIGTKENTPKRHAEAQASLRDAPFLT